MNIRAAELIDGENISPKLAGNVHAVIEREIQRGVSLVTRILAGNQQTLETWSVAFRSLPFECKTHAGGKNAADSLLKVEAMRLAREGVSRFYVLSNDRDFAALAQLLQSWGCQVIGFGTLHAAAKWQCACDLFLQVGVDPTTAATQIAALTHPIGGFMSFFTKELNIYVSHEQKLEALKLFYNDEQEPSSLSSVLDRLLEHTLAALCLQDQDLEMAGEWSAQEDAAMLAAGVRDPLLRFLLEQDPTVKQHWETVQAFASRCGEAYEQGQAAAQKAFPSFPHHRFHALHQNHLAALLSTWQYNTYNGSIESQKVYPGYTLETEQVVLRSWFRRGYFAGATQRGLNHPETNKNEDALSL